ncbi:MAG: hypothetical protein HYZ83_00700 [Candidatus Omnitrophica bacterium]|nr:hypothetical protein [Candidatus Omnitrophota bacterium]
MKPFDMAKFLEVIDHNAKPLVKETPLHEVERLNQKLKSVLATLSNHAQTSGPKGKTA